MRPQFAWDDSDPTDRWKTEVHFEGGVNVGITVFIGLANCHRFTKDDIIDTLDISSKLYTQLLHRYKKHMLEAMELDMSGLLREERGFSKKFYIKTMLVQSALKLHYRCPDINFASIEA